LFVIRVSGSRREPVPPASTTPFMADAMLVACGLERGPGGRATSGSRSAGVL